MLLENFRDNDLLHVNLFACHKAHKTFIRWLRYENLILSSTNQRLNCVNCKQLLFECH